MSLQMDRSRRAQTCFPREFESFHTGGLQSDSGHLRSTRNGCAICPPRFAPRVGFRDPFASLRVVRFFFSFQSDSLRKSWLLSAEINLAYDLGPSRPKLFSCAQC